VLALEANAVRGVGEVYDSVGSSGQVDEFKLLLLTLRILLVDAACFVILCEFRAIHCCFGSKSEE
jgi:hypothetical protein